MPSRIFRPLWILLGVLAACGPAPAAVCPKTTVAAAAPQPSAAAAAPRCLTIVSWNDMHGQLRPDVVPADTGLVPAGGVVAVADRVAEARAGGDAVVVLDGGDLFTGPLESSIAEGAPIIAAYGVIGVDAATIGNHEFDFGPAGYDRVTAPAGVGDDAGAAGPRGALEARMAEAKFPFVAANVRYANGASPAWPHLVPSARVARDGWEVGVVGYTTRETPTTTMKPNVADLDFAKDAAAHVAAEIRALRAAGAAPVVLLAHASLEGDLPQQLDAPDDPAGEKRVGEMADLMDALGPDKPDLIVGGHRHAWLLGRVRGVPIVTSDQHGVGVARSRFCKDGGAPKLEGIERDVAVATTPPRTPLGAEVAAAIAPWLEKVRAQAEAPVATLAKGCAHQALDGTALAEQIARAIADHAGDAAPPPKGVPVVGVMNAGGVRAPLRAGPMRFADLFAVSPFENQVAVCATTRAGLGRALANALARPSARERFPFGLAGARVTVARRADGMPEIVHLDVPGATKDTDPVWLALPDFLLWGGDGFLEGVACSAQATSQSRIRDAWRAVIAKEQACDGAPKDVSVQK